MKMPSQSTKPWTTSAQNDCFDPTDQRVADSDHADRENHAIGIPARHAGDRE